MMKPRMKTKPSGTAIPDSANGQQKRLSRWKPGESGNPKGRAPGPTKITQAIQTLFEGEGDAIGRKAVELALAGDTVALRLVLDRIAPPRRGSRIELPLGDLEGAQGLQAATNVIVSAMGAGIVSAEEAESMSRVIDAAGAAMERREIFERLSALEAENDK